jgi:hypothetical protein
MSAPRTSVLISCAREAIHAQTGDVRSSHHQPSTGDLQRTLTDCVDIQRASQNLKTKEWFASTSLPSDVVLELLDHEFLLGDNIFDEVTDGNKAD